MLQRYLPGVDLDLGAVVARVGHWWSQLDVVDLEQGAGLGDLHCQGCHPIDFDRGEQRRTGKSPGPVHDDPHAKALALVVRQALDHPVLDGDVLGPPPDDADVGIACASNLCQVQGSISYFFQFHPPFSSTCHFLSSSTMLLRSVTACAFS